MTIVIVPDVSNRIVPPTDILSVQSNLIDFVTAPGSTALATVRDATFLNTTTAATRRDRQIFAALTPATNRQVAFRSLNESIATVNSQGYVQSVSGTTQPVNIMVESPWASTRFAHQAGPQGGQTASIFQNYLAGTLGVHATSQLTTAAGLSQNKFVYTSRNNATSSYVRNPNCWITANLTSWPAWCTTGQHRFCGMMISPRHIMLAAHCNNANNSTFRFVTSDNQVIDRTMTSRVNVGTFDLSIGVLNADLPNTISFAKVLPANWLDYLTLGPIPIVAGDQEGKLVSRETTIYVANGTARIIAHRDYPSGSLATLTETIIGGDSGSPLFSVINGEVVALGCHFTAVGCPMISAYTSEVNAAMTTLGGGYQLTPIDLSGFNFYGT